MRWVASLFALFLTMAWLHHLTAASALEARAGFALGFLLVGAWLAGELAARAGLPRLTGFLIVGLSGGPAWLNLVRADELQALGFVQHAAVAVLAFAAGRELSLATLRADRQALVRLASGTLGFPALAVAGIVLSVAPWFPLTLHQGFRTAIGVALTLGVCAAAPSPVVIEAVSEELGARGTLAESILRVAVVNTVAVMGLLALVLLVAHGLGTVGAVAGAVAPAFAARAIAALAVGAVLGVLVNQFARVVQRDAMLVLVGLGLVVAAAERAFGLEPMLVALVAGVVARNVGEPGASLQGVVQEASLPAQAVFFALTGAALRVGAFAELWPWIVLLAGVRVVALRYGTLWAGRVTVVPPSVARHGWLGLIPQSGIVLALAATARRAFPAFGVSLETLVVGTVVVYEVAGPVCLRWALERVGDVGGRGPEPHEPPAEPVAGGGAGAGGEWAVPRLAHARRCGPRRGAGWPEGTPMGRGLRVSVP